MSNKIYGIFKKKNYEFSSLDGSLQQPQKISYDSSHVENWDTGDHETTE